jgi:hypothetical protein
VGCVGLRVYYGWLNRRPDRSGGEEGWKDGRRLFRY